MNSDNGKKNTHDPGLEHLDMQTSDAASSTDLTGLIPANPDEGIDEYKRLKGFGSDVCCENKF